MQKTSICGLGRNDMTAAGASRPQVSMNDIKLEARHTGCPVVIEHVSGRWIAVMPGGAVIGTSSAEPMGAFEAEHLAWSMDNGNDYQVELERVVGR
jgi:hypothetical protein